MTDWGVHLINMMLMGMGPEEPKSAYSCGGKFVLDDNSETPDSQVTVYEFPNYTLIWEHKAGLNNGLYNRSWGIEWSGTEGNIILNDEGWEIRPEKKKANLDNQRKPGSPDPRPAHVRNFLDCVKSRQRPISDVEEGFQVSTAYHLANLSLRLGRKLEWDAAKWRFTNNNAANQYLRPVNRKGWELKDIKV